MDNKVKGKKIEVVERKDGRKVRCYDIREVEFEDTHYPPDAHAPDGVVIRSILLSCYAGPPLERVMVADHGAPKATRAVVLAKAAELAKERGAEFNGRIE
jgi:hypothetical protein